MVACGNPILQLDSCHYYHHYYHHQYYSLLLLLFIILLQKYYSSHLRALSGEESSLSLVWKTIFLSARLPLPYPKERENPSRASSC